MQGMENASVWIMYLQKLEYNNDSGAVAATDEDDAANYVFLLHHKIIHQANQSNIEGISPFKLAVENIDN